MFGDNNIYGVWKATVDNKSRIIIPHDTLATTNDELVLRSHDTYFEITTKALIEEYIKSIQSIFSNNPNQETLKEVENILNDYYITILTTSKLDKQRRFNTNGHISQGEYKIIGARKSIYVMDNETYLKKVKKSL